jgi:uncharacterized protein (TIGR00730 family)
VAQVSQASREERGVTSLSTEAETNANSGLRELHFSKPNEQVDTVIHQLIGLVGGVQHPGIVREMILAALKAGQENSATADLKLMTSTLKELRHTARVFARYREVRKVTIFGSARVEPDAATYRLARSLGRGLSQAGYMVITGGGQGIMQAGNEGAGVEHSFGVSIRLPCESEPNHVLQGSPRSISYKYFFNRKVAFIKEADAVALFPGGFGTLDEAMEVLTLVQTGKCYPIPLVLVDEPGGTYWSNWKQYLEQELAARGYIGPDDLSLFSIVDSAAAAIAIIDRFYRRYHSLRFVRGRLVMRLSASVDAEHIARWKGQFGDILGPSGEFVLSGALPEEADEPSLAHLSRLVVDFNRKGYSRLRQLIDAINAA